MRAVTGWLLTIVSCYHAVLGISLGLERIPVLGSENQPEQLVTFWMPNINTTKENEKYCMGKNLDFDMKYSVKTIPHITSESVENILIYGCYQSMEHASESAAGSCVGGHQVLFACPGGRARIIYSWAKGVPTVDLPQDVGFPLGSRAGIRSVFMQIQYSSVMTNDNSGVIVALTDERPKYIAGIFLMAAGGQLIPPGRPETKVDVKCRYQDDVVIHPFAFRTHAHGLGVVISGWHMNPEDSTQEWTMLGKQNPQNPQVFYPMQTVHTITKGTVLGARCVYNSTSRASPTYMGLEETDEMCNFYFAYYAQSSIQHDTCGDVVPSAAMYQLPEEASVPLSPSEIVTPNQGDPIIPATDASQIQGNDLDTALGFPLNLFQSGGDNSSQRDTMYIIGLSIYSQSDDDESSTTETSTEAVKQSYWRTMAGDVTGGSDLCLVLLILVIVLTVIVLSGGMILCIRQSKSKVAESKFKNLLYKIETNAKKPMNEYKGYAPMKV